MTKREEALRLAEETLELLETGTSSLTPIVLRTLRVGRLVENESVVLWMRLELRGYGLNGPGQGLNWSLQADWSGRRVPKSEPPTYWVTPIEEIESHLSVARDRLRASQAPSTTVAESGAPAPAWGTQTVSEKLLTSYRAERNAAESEIAKWVSIVATLRGSLQEWLSDLVTTLKYGEVIENAFSRAKSRFDGLLRSTAPEVAAALSAAYSRSGSAEPEEWSQSLGSCRRALKALADALYPPSLPKDGHDLTDAAYKNRLIQFVKESISSGSQRAVLLADLETVIARVDALNDLVSKGVHDRTQSEEVDIAIVQTYVFAGELLSLSGADVAEPVQSVLPGPDESAAQPVAAAQEARAAQATGNKRRRKGPPSTDAKITSASSEDAPTKAEDSPPR